MQGARVIENCSRILDTAVDADANGNTATLAAALLQVLSGAAGSESDHKDVPTPPVRAPAAVVSSGEDIQVESKVAQESVLLLAPPALTGASKEP
jgi:hypothetical protein